MHELSLSLGMKLWPEQYNSVDIDLGVIREEKLPDETDLDLLNRTIEKAECMLSIAIERAIKLRTNIVVTGYNQEEIDMMANQAKIKLAEIVKQQKIKRIQGGQTNVLGK